MTYTAPIHLTSEQNTESFDCGEVSLNRWLKERAIDSEANGAARTYVVCVENQVVGYYCLSTGSIVRAQAPRKIRRNMPDPMPVLVLGRLAVDLNHQGKGIGSALIKDAVLRTLQASEIAGIRALLVHALNDSVKQFYEQCGFVPSPIYPLTLMLSLADTKKSFEING
jgi:GNAT superfamily N-acetyltransferase